MMRWLVALALGVSGCANAPTRKPTDPAPAPGPRALPGVATCPREAPTATTENATKVLGAKIEKVCLFNTGGGAGLELRDVVSSREGQPLTAEGVARDLEALLLPGTVRDARAIVQPLASGGVVLAYVVSEYPLIGKISFEGVHAVSVTALGNLALGYAYSSPTAISRLANAMAQLYQERGFSRVQITPRVLGGAPGRTEIVFVVQEGPLTTVSSIRFVGSKRLTPAELKTVLRSTVDAPYLEEQASADAAALVALYLDKGMIQAKVTHATAPGKAPHLPELVFTIEEGDVFTLGKLSLSGHKLGDDKAVLKTLEARPGAVFSRAAIRRDIERLRTRAAAQGVTIDVTPVTTVDPGNRQRIDMVLEIEKRP